MKVRFWLRLPVIVWRLLWDRRVPMLPRCAVVLAIVYLLVPMDIVPDRALGLLGYVDDLAFLVLAVAWLLLRAPGDALRDAQRARSREEGTPR
jgi:uncharacterized membrane protein YkvA (DUF1232 family)